MITVETAMAYLAAGLSVLPAIRAEKRPSVGAWKTWAGRLPSEYEVKAWFGNHPDGVCIVAGSVSGNLECMDFDNHGELYESWKAKVDPGLFSRLVVETTPSGGYHVLYRSATKIEGNLKLARGERNAKLATLIETRGEGGLFLCSPTSGYTAIQGEFAHIPTLSEEEREQLLSAARELNEAREAPKSAPYGVSGGGAGDQPAPAAGANTGAVSGDGGDFLTRPGDDFCRRGEIRPILESHGWQFLGSKPDGNELWRRPCKESGGHSATFDGNVFYVFSSNAAPFESERGYSRFQVYATLECGGDYTRAARELLGKGYGQSLPEKPVDFSGLSATVGGQGRTDANVPAILPLGELVDRYPKMKSVLIHGFLRRGETMNIIAPPKTGKSWLVTDLALSVATGTPWFGFPCEKGKVLIIDNELHPETSANRIPKVVAARGIDIKKVRNDIYVENQRGRLGSIEDLANRIETLKPYGFRLVIIDAFYRAMPKGTDENDNGTVAGIYNLIDKYAAALDCAFVLIHHTSKGNQSLKAVTDVGAGFGISEKGASYTLTARDQHAVAYAIDSMESNAMKSKNPKSGCREVECAPTLTTVDPAPVKHQGGTAVVAFLPGNSGKARSVAAEEEVSPTLMRTQGESGNKVAVAAEVVGVFDMEAGKSGGRADTSGVSPTILALNSSAFCHFLKCRSVFLLTSSSFALTACSRLYWASNLS